MVEVIKVVRPDGIARQVTLGVGGIEITYILGPGGKPQEIKRLCQAQVIDSDALYLRPADYRQIIKRAAAILREKRKKARAV